MTGTPLRHGDTEGRREGFDAVLETGFEWIRRNARPLGIALGLLLLVGAGSAIVYELGRRSEAEAADALAEVEDAFAGAMGGRPGVALIPEPANEAIAQRAREAALVGFEELIADHASSEAARLAAIRAAEMEVDLGRLEAAGTRLEALASGMDADDLRRAVALRLQAYVLDELGESLAAGEAYERAAEVHDYPARAPVLIAAGEVFERAGEHRRAIDAYQQALSVAPDQPNRAGLLRRIAILEYRAGSAVVGSDKEHSVK